MGVNGSLKAEQQDDTRPSKFLDEVLDELDELRWGMISSTFWYSFSCLRWNRVLRSLQALVFSLLPSYWDIASDVGWVCFVKFYKSYIAKNSDLAWNHLHDHNMRWTILQVRHAWLFLGKVKHEPKLHQCSCFFYFSAWRCCWCSCQEPSCTVLKANGLRRNGGGGGDSPASSFPSLWSYSR